MKKAVTRLFYLLALVSIIEVYLYANHLTHADPTATAVHQHASDEQRQKPALEVKHQLRGNDLHLQLEVQRFTFSLENMGKENKYGEGHVHLYLDGKKVAKIFERTYVYADIPPGQHEVTVELAHNNHESYGVKRSFGIDIKQ